MLTETEIAKLKEEKEKLYTELETLSEKKSEIRRQHNQPLEWMKDDKYRAICHLIEEIHKSLELLTHQLDQHGQEVWLKNMQENYPDGQV